MRLVRLVSFVCVLVAIAPGRSPAVVAQDPAATAAEAAARLAELEIAADYGNLFALLHPDARAVVPYEAMAGWYADVFWPRGPYPVEILAVDFVAWTWGVTGVTYPWTAEVVYRQTFWDGGARTSEEAVVHLVEADGAWRWFFGASRAFLAEQSALYAAPAAPAAMAPSLTTAADWLYADLDGFWWGVSWDGGWSYASPGFVAFAGEASTPCGLATSALGPASYCPLDGTIYWETGWLAALSGDWGEAAWIAVIAHEWGHHVQALLGLARSLDPDDLGERYPIDLELLADCLGGSYVQDAEWRGLLGAADVEIARSFAYASGDTGVPWFDANAHGTPDMRLSSFLTGYGEGVAGCGLF
jgi:predicted metalloprotease